MVVDVADRPQLERGILGQELVQASCTQGEGADGLGAVQLLGHSRHHAPVDEIHDTVGDQLGVHTQVRVAVQRGQDGVGDRADTGLDRCPVRDSLGEVRGDAVVDVRGRWRGHLHQRVVGLVQPTTWLT